MTQPDFHTADICDRLGKAARVAKPGFRRFGNLSHFSGPARTIKCIEDNSKVRAVLETRGEGAVLVVDGGASLRCALLGDRLATLAVDNGWAGVIVNGCIRDSAVIDRMPIGVRALGTNPRRSKKRDSGDADVTLDFAGVVVRPGDMVYADVDGWLVTSVD